MPSKIRNVLLISITVIALLITSVHTSYTEAINYIYDEINRLIRVEYADGTKIVYTYDKAGNRSHVYIGEYTLAVNVVGSGTVTKNPDQPIYSAGSNVTLTAVNGSQTFSEWSGDLTGNTNPTTIGMNGNKSVTATFITPGGWLQGWTYRKPVTLSRASGAVTNYQMRLLVGETSGASGENVDCNGHIQANFNDLRFTTSDGVTLLDYWIESITGTTPNRLATVWVEFDSIGTSETTFYMYYGKSGATAYSNGDNTFTFFDDFPGSSLDTTTKWNVILQTGSSTITVSGGILSLKAIVGGSSAWTYCWIRQKSSFTRPYAVNVRWKEPDPSGAWAAFNPIHGIINGGEQIGFERQTNSSRHWRKYIGGVSTYILTESWSTDSAWHLHEFLFTTTHFTAKLDGAVKVNAHAESTPASGTTDLKAVDYYAGYTHESQFDYIFVRNYNSPEPVWGSWGAEQPN
jgi:YD repeat-containing protein